MGDVSSCGEGVDGSSPHSLPRTPYFSSSFNLHPPQPLPPSPPNLQVEVGDLCLPAVQVTCGNLGERVVAGRLERGGEGQ